MKTRKPWVALVFTLICPGLGQLYNGNARLAGAVFVLGSVFTTLSIFFLFDSFSKLMCALALGIVFSVAVAVQAWREARRLGAIELRPFQRWWVYLGFVLLLYGIPDGYGVLMPSRFLSFQIPSESMVPTLLVGDRLVADGWSFWGREPQRGQVVVFDFPKDPKIKYVKRVLGVPGDIVEVRDGEIYLNGKMLEQARTGREVPAVGGWQPQEFMEALGAIKHIVYRTPPTLVQNLAPVKVPPEHYFMVGDNRDRSNDSRFWGVVHRDAIVGRMAYIYWSWDSAAKRMRWERMGTAIE